MRKHKTRLHVDEYLYQPTHKAYKEPLSAKS